MEAKKEVDFMVTIVDEHIIPAIKIMIKEELDVIRSEFSRRISLLEQHTKDIQEINKWIDSINSVAVRYFENKLKEN